MILDNPLQSERLDTLEEVSEPASSEYWQLDSIGSKESTNITTNVTTGNNISITNLKISVNRVGINFFNNFISCLTFFDLEKTSLSGISFQEEMFSTSEIELVETTIAVTQHSPSTITLKDTYKTHGKKSR